MKQFTYLSLIFALTACDSEVQYVEATPVEDVDEAELPAELP